MGVSTASGSYTSSPSTTTGGLTAIRWCEVSGNDADWNTNFNELTVEFTDGTSKTWSKGSLSCSSGSATGLE